MNSKKIILITVVILTVAIFFILKKNKKESFYGEEKPFYGPISVTISTNGIVTPRNRLEIKPSIAGRIEKVLVKEGDLVKPGEILAWMSSLDRAALLDAARSKGTEEFRKWEDVYKPTPVIAPLSGFIIKRSVEPGQTINSQDAILVMADTLIIQAQVDETDIGKLKPGQSAHITLDAYPDEKIQGKIEHIAYESQVVNNVTIYQVDILPVTALEIFRSGMSATVDIIEQEKENALLLPLEAINYDKKNSFVLINQGNNNKPIQRPIKIGLTDNFNAEIISGLSPDDKIMIPGKKNLPKKNDNTKNNPFMPSRGRGR